MMIVAPYYTTTDFDQKYKRNQNVTESPPPFLLLMAGVIYERSPNTNDIFYQAGKTCILQNSWGCATSNKLIFLGGIK